MISIYNGCEKLKKYEIFRNTLAWSNSKFFTDMLNKSVMSPNKSIEQLLVLPEFVNMQEEKIKDLSHHVQCLHNFHTLLMEFFENIASNLTKSVFDQLKERKYLDDQEFTKLFI